MSTANQIQIMLFQKVRHNTFTKSNRNSSFIDSPSLNILIRIRPKQITKQTYKQINNNKLTLIRNVGRSCYIPKLIQAKKLRTQTSMHTYYFIVDQRRHWHSIKGVIEQLPQFNTITPLTFVVETVYFVDTGAFVVSSQ